MEDEKSTKKTSPIVIMAIIALLIIVGVAYFVKQQPQPTQETQEDAMMMSAKVPVVLAAQNDSGESGEAMLSEIDGQTKITLALNGAPTGVAQPVHIHTGSCAELGGVAYPLTNLQSGLSETMLDMPLDELLAQLPLAINAHKSAEEIGVYVACGDIPVK